MSEAEIASTTSAADANRDDVIKHLKEQLAEKTKGEAEAQARAGRSCFKSSTRKGEGSVAAHATNVHAYLASVRGVEGGAALLAMCTAGAPAAARIARRSTLCR